MGSAFSLQVPEEEQTLATAEAFFEYHIDNSKHDDSLEEMLEYEFFKEDYEETGDFFIFKKPTKTVERAAEPSFTDIYFEYEDEDGAIRDPEGLEKFVEALEAARENLKQEGDYFEGRDWTIEMCINIIEFAKENGYGVNY